MRPLDDPAVNVRENSDSRPSERDGENKITGCSKFSCIAFFRWRHQHIFKHPSVTKLQKHLSPCQLTGAVQKRLEWRIEDQSPIRQRGLRESVATGRMEDIVGLKLH